MPAVMPVQLDIFDDSRDVMLRNDVLQALQQRNAAKARTVWQRLVQEYPQERLAADLLTLIELLEGQASLTSAPGDKPVCTWRRPLHWWPTKCLARRSRSAGCAHCGKTWPSAPITCRFAPNMKRSTPRPCC